MCRIVGIKSYRKDKANEIIDIGRKMRDSLLHGGPDDFGEYFDSEVGLFLGHRRLSIIDTTSGGHQPMFYLNYVIVFNGELYNYKSLADELRKYGYIFETTSDTEVLLKAWVHWGSGCLEKFHGMFSFVLWDLDTKRMILCRDRYGVKPLYWYQKDGIFLFSSELKAFYQFPEFDREIDRSSLILYLQYGYIRAPYSIYKKVKKVNPGCYLEFNCDGMINEVKYYKLPHNFIKPQYKSTENLLAEAEDILSKSFKYRMISDVPIGIFLSSGIDSSLLLALLRKELNCNLKTFTIGFNNSKYDESKFAKKIAEHFETEHYELICDDDVVIGAMKNVENIFDEPFADSSAIPTYLVSCFAKENVTVALSADGADEIFAGYDRYRAVKYYQRSFDLIPNHFRCSNAVSKIAEMVLRNSMLNNLLNLNNKNVEARISKFLNSISAKNAADYFNIISMIEKRENIKKILNPNNYEEPSFDYEIINKNNLFSQLAWFDFNNYLEGDILTKIDRTTMATSLEGREPFLDQSIVEFGLGLEDSYKVKGKSNKWILREILKRHLPSELIQTKKLGFGIPLKEILFSNLKNEIINMGYDSVFLNFYSFDQAYFKKFIQDFFNSNNFINPHFVWALLMLYKWHYRWNKVTT